MRLLVTGGAGFIGANFVHHVLAESDHEVVTLDALSYAGSKADLDGALDDPRHEFVEGDIRNRDLVEGLVSAARGESLPVYGDGTNVREWTYVADNCRATEKIERLGWEPRWTFSGGLERTVDYYL